MFSLPMSMLLYMMPKEMQQFPIIFKFIGRLQYDVWQMFGKLNCDLIYEDKAVCSARESGVRGLGTELCRRTEELAKELGCTHTYAMVTGKTVVVFTVNTEVISGKYSRRIFEKLDHTILTEVVYADFKDENGQLYLKDTREHLSCITCVKELK